MVIGANSKQLRRNEQRVNLLPAFASRRDSRSGRFRPGVLLVAALAVVSWAAAAVGLALLLGWRPGFGVGP